MSALIWHKPIPRLLWLGRLDFGLGAISHDNAKTLTTNAFQSTFQRAPSLCERQFIQAVAWLESNYGAGWKGEGAGSNNMGAVQAGKPPCGPGTFLYTDTNPNEQGVSIPYQVCFKAYATPQAGFDDLARVLYKQRPTVLAAATRCDIRGVSTAMYDTHYYTGFGATREARINNHVKALTQKLKTITTALSEPMPAGGGTGAAAGAGAGAAIAGAALIGGLLYLLVRTVGRAA